MTLTISKSLVSLGAALALVCVNGALAAGLTQAVSARETADVKIASADTSAVVFATNQRATNLQKTPTAIIVSGIETGRKHSLQK